MSNFLFGTEIRMIQINPEGWMVGVWDGDNWEISHPFWDPDWPSHQNPTNYNTGRCSKEMPELVSSSARDTSVKSAQGVLVSSRPIDRTPGIPGSDKNGKGGVREE